MSLSSVAVCPRSHTSFAALYSVLTSVSVAVDDLDRPRPRLRRGPHVHDHADVGPPQESVWPPAVRVRIRTSTMFLFVTYSARQSFADWSVHVIRREHW